MIDAKLDEVAFEGRYRVAHAGDDYWGTGQPYTGAELTDPTWLDLCVEVERMIRTVGDTHHSFLEGANVRDNGTIELFMGS